MLANLANVPHNQIDLLQFSFANNDDHLRIIAAIFKQGNILLPTYILDPIPTADIGAWLYVHQTVHNQMNSVLSIDGSDLTSVDFGKQDELAAWIWQHYREHYQANQTLGQI